MSGPWNWPQRVGMLLGALVWLNILLGPLLRSTLALHASDGVFAELLFAAVGLGGFPIASAGGGVLVELLVEHFRRL